MWRSPSADEDNNKVALALAGSGPDRSNNKIKKYIKNWNVDFIQLMLKTLELFI